MPDYFRAVRAGKDTEIATGAVHPDGTIDVALWWPTSGRAGYRKPQAHFVSMDELVASLSTMSTTGVEIVWISETDAAVYLEEMAKLRPDPETGP